MPDTELEQLRREVAGLKRVRDDVDELLIAALGPHAEPGGGGWYADVSQLITERDAARAEVERLTQLCRELEARANRISRCTCDNDGIECTHEAARGIAEAERDERQARIEVLLRRWGDDAHELEVRHQDDDAWQLRRCVRDLRAALQDDQPARAALAGDQPKAEHPNCCDWPDDHAGKVCPERDLPAGELLSIEPLSGEALRAVEEADDADLAGYTPSNEDVITGD